MQLFCDFWPSALTEYAFFALSSHPPPTVYEKCLILSASLSERSPSVSLVSAICSTHAALSPFQSQYLVVIAADCFQGGDRITTQTCRCYVTPSFHPIPPLLIVCPSILGGIPMPLFVSLHPCSLSVSSPLLCMRLRSPSTPSVCLCLSRGRL